jgi:hypothetical protein
MMKPDGERAGARRQVTSGETAMSFRSMLVLLSCILLAWVPTYFLISRFCFRSRPKKWERFEDMMNDGVETSMLLLSSFYVATGVGAALFLVIANRFPWL